MPHTDALLSLFVNKEMGAQKIEPIATSPTGEKGQSQNPTPYPSQPQPWVPEDTSFPLRPQDMSFMQTKYGVIVMAVTSNEPFYFQNPTVISHRICSEDSLEKDYEKPEAQRSLVGTADKYVRDKGWVTTGSEEKGVPARSLSPPSVTHESTLLRCCGPGLLPTVVTVHKVTGGKLCYR